MKKLLKFTAIFLALTFLLLLTAPLLFKGKIMGFIESQANENLKATLTFKDVDISLIRNFPNFSIEIQELALQGVDTFKEVRLFEFQRLKLVVDVMSLIGDKPISIRQIALKDAKAHLVVLPDGTTNWDIFSTEPTDSLAPVDTVSSAYALALKQYVIENFSMIYDDQQADMYFEMKNLQHSGKGDFTQDIVQLQTQTQIAEINFVMDKIALLTKVQVASDFGVTVHQTAERIEFAENNVYLNKLGLNFKGAMAFVPEGMDLDIQFDAPQNQFGEVLSLIPAFYMQGFEDLKTKGGFELSGFVKGLLPDEGDDLPAYGLHLAVKDGYISYPDVPEAIEQLAFLMDITAPAGPADRVRIAIPQAKCMVANNPFSAQLDLQTPLSDPNFDFALQTNMELANFQKILREAGFDMAGRIIADMAIKGKLSDFEGENFEQVVASGDFSMTNFRYTDPSFPFPVMIPAASATLAPNQVQIPNFDLNLGQSDFSAKGSLLNAYSWMLHDTTLYGQFQFSSNFMNINELMLFAAEDSVTATTATAAAEDSTLIAPVIPKNVHFAMDATANKMLYDDISIENFKGKLLVAHKKVVMEGVQMQTLGGQVGMAGSFASDGVAAPKANFDFDLANLDLDLVFDHVTTFQTLIPVAEAVQGKLTTKFSFDADLDAALTPLFPSVNAIGGLKTAGITFQSAALNQAAQQLNHGDLSNLKFKNATIDFKVKGGRIAVQPFDVTLAGQSARVSGSHGIDNSLDYTIAGKFPLGNIAQSVVKLPVGGNLQQVDLEIGIGGTFAKPQIKFNTKSALNAVTDQVTNLVKSEINKQVDNAKEQARAKAAQLIAEAEAKGNQLVAEAKKAGDKLRQEAKTAGDKLIANAQEGASKLKQEAGNNPIKAAAADRAGRELIKKAEAEALKLNQEADKRASELEQKAQKEKEALITKAQQQAAGI